jgi:hypothetical protein
MSALRRLQPSGERKEAVIPRRHRKRVKRPNAAIGRLDFYTLSTFWTLAIEEAKWMNVQSPISPVSVALRLSGQPYAYKHNEPKERGDHAGCDANRRPDGQDLFGENKQR